MLKDLRHAFRLLLQAKGWTAVVLVSLALGIGANTALFSAVNGLLLRKLPVSDPDSLVRFRWSGRNDMATDSSDYGYSGKDASGRNMRATVSYPMFQAFVAANRTLTDLIACAPLGRLNVVFEGPADIANGFETTGNFFRVLGVRAIRGRTIGPDDDRPDAPAVAVISARYWRSRFTGDPEIVNKVIRVNNVPLTIIGVINPAFTGVQQVSGEPPDIWVPLALDTQLNVNEERLSKPTYWWLEVMGRRKPGATPQQVQGNFEGMFQATARAGFDSYRAGLPDSDRNTFSLRDRSQVPNLHVDDGNRGVYEASDSEVRSVAILSVVVALMLLIVCANVANLLLSRATARRKEISVRLSLGATRKRLVRQFLTESIVLSGIGGALGVLVGYWGRKLLPGQTAQGAPIDLTVLVFVVGVTVLTGILFGSAPALRATDVDVNAALKETGRSVVGSRSVLGKALLVVQVAVSLVLLIAAALFLRTLHNLRDVDVGFNPRNLALFRVNPRLNRYDDAKARVFYTELIDRLAALPGVSGAAMSQPALLSGSTSSTAIFRPGRTYQPREVDEIYRVIVSPSFFSTMQMPVVRGRGFAAEDGENAPKVVVINETAARKYFPNEDPIGRRFGTSVETNNQLEIVGVVHDAKYNSLRDAVPPTMYVDYRQARFTNAAFEVRTAGDPLSVVGSIREAVRALDPNMPVTNVSTQVEQIENRLQQERLFAQAYALFGGLALLLAAIGLFGLMSYSVARRTNEIGIRMALGARRGDVVRLVMRESMVLVALGVVIGLGVAFTARRLVETLLFGLAASDFQSIGAAVMTMIIVSAIAGYLPARRASRVDAMVALRYE
jgi:predicted permease